MAIASEIKQFTKTPWWQFKPNGQRCYDFLNWGVLDHTSETMFNDILQLQGGHYFFFTVESIAYAVPKPMQWYQLKEKPFKGTFGEACEQYKAILTDSIRLRLHADVEVGSCLSGGLDSSSIVCIAEGLLKNSKHTLKTFTAGSEHPKHDETDYVRAVIEKIKVDPHFIIPESSSLFKMLPDLVWHQDEPFISTSIFAQWEVFNLVKENRIKVMLDGQGADECLGGYHGFFANHLFDLLRSFKWKKLALEYIHTKKRHPQLSLFMMLANKIAPTGMQQHFRKILGRKSIHSGWINTNAMLAKPSTPYPPSPSFSEQSRQQLFVSSVPMLLHFEDRNSMAHSIESRTPFLDYRLVEFTFNCPTEYKVSKGETKRILRNALKDTLPKKVLERHDKMGFLTAEELWFKTQSPKQLLDGIKKAIDLSMNMLSPKLIHQTHEMLEGKRAFDYSFWRALCFGAWLERFN